MKHTKITPWQDNLLDKIGYESHYEGDKLVDVATWLRETKGWHVETQPTYMNKPSWQGKVIGIPLLQLHEIVYADTHDLALSAGIDFILTKLNEDDTHPTN
jgi:hypothetical protein